MKIVRSGAKVTWHLMYQDAVIHVGTKQECEDVMSSLAHLIP